MAGSIATAVAKIGTAIKTAKTSTIILGAITIGSTAYQIAAQSRARRNLQERIRQANAQSLRIHPAGSEVPVLYGRTAVRGIQSFPGTVGDNFPFSPTGNNVIGTLPAQSGSNNQFLLTQYVLGVGNIGGVYNWWNGDSPVITGDLLNNIVGEFNNGGTASVTATRFCSVAGFNNIAGNGTGDRTATDLYTDKAYFTVVAKHDRDDPKVFGVPDPLCALEGRTLRQITRSGNDYSITNNETFSANFVDVLLDYLTNELYGPNVGDANIDLPSFWAARQLAANVIQGTATINTVENDALREAGYPSLTTDGFIDAYTDFIPGTDFGFVPATSSALVPATNYPANLQRHEYNGPVSTNRDFPSVIDNIMATVPQALLFYSSEGKWKLSIGDPTRTAADQSVMNIGQNELINHPIIVTPESNNKLNSLTVQYADVEKDYTDNAVTWPEPNGALHTALLAEDNNQNLSNEVYLQGVSNHFTAKAIAATTVNLSRRNVYQCDCTTAAVIIEPGDVFRLFDPAQSLDVYCRAVRVAVNDDLTVSITAIEFRVSDYAWQFDEKANLNNLIAYTTDVGTPATISVSITNGASVVMWTPNSNELATVSQYELQRSDDNGANFFNVATVASSELAYSELVSVVDITDVVYRVRALTVNGRRSGWRTSDPIGVTGLSIEAGETLQIIYTVTDNGTTAPVIPTSTSAQLMNNTYVPTNWSRIPVPVSLTSRYQWISARQRATPSDNWNEWLTPIRGTGFVLDGETGEDGVGVEYVFTSSVTGARISGTANLPVATWNYDDPRLTNGITRGIYTYYDGTPNDLSANRPFIHRFRRPVAGSPDANTDIGSVPWIQESGIRAIGRAGEAGDDGQGFEYIFTSSSTATPISSTNSLPDPNWNYDDNRLRQANGQLRGAFRYYDGVPGNLASDRPFIIRFRRIITGTPAQNADIGNVPWIQERAYRAVGEAGQTGPQGVAGPQGIQGIAGADGTDGAQGDAGVGLEYIFARTNGTTPSAPSNSWGFDAPRGVWQDAAPSINETNNTLWQSVRTVLGSPATGAAVSDNWSTPAVVGFYGPRGPAGIQGIAGAQGQDGEGLEYIFARTTGTTPSAPSNSWGFDRPQAPWSDDAPSLTATQDTLWRAFRAIEGSPTAGAAVSATWSTPRVVGAFGPQGQQGAQGDKGDTGEKGDTGDTGPQGPRGATGATGARGPAGGPGSDGPRGERRANGFLYWTGTDTNTAPTAPSATGVGFNWTTGRITSLPANFSNVPPSLAVGTRNNIWTLPYAARETYNSGTNTYTTSVTFGAVSRGLNFTGVVTFNDGTGDFSEGSTTITNINGGRIRTGSITLDKLQASSYPNVAGVGTTFVLGTPAELTFFAGTSSIGAKGYAANPYKATGYFEDNGNDFALAAVQNAEDFPSEDHADLHYAFGALSESGRVACFYARNGDSSTWYDVCIGEGDNAIQAPDFTLTRMGQLTASRITSTSDARLKSDITPIDNALTKLDAVNGYTFTMNGEAHAGVVAQELQKVCPQAVKQNDKGYLTVDPLAAIGFLLQAVKALKEQVDDLAK